MIEAEEEEEEEEALILLTRSSRNSGVSLREGGSAFGSVCSKTTPTSSIYGGE